MSNGKARTLAWGSLVKPSAPWRGGARVFRHTRTGGGTRAVATPRVGEAYSSPPQEN